MKDEVSLHVFAVLPGAQILRVGRLLSRNLHRPGRFEGFFRYDPEYLRHPQAYPLDPVHLPLTEEASAADNGDIGLHWVFDDSLPDAWGRQLLARKGRLEQLRPAPAHLLAVLRNQGLGRLLFTETNRQPVLKDGSISLRRIASALEEVGKLEADLGVDTEELRHLLACGSSAGGARPKVLSSWRECQWIAKLSSRRDPAPGLMVALEEAGLTLAAAAGLQVPEIHRHRVGERELLLIRRFDVTSAGGRNGLVSFRTLLGVEDPLAVSYSDLAAVVARYSAAPAADLEQLFRQMTVNVLLRNTDDHLQNFSMLHTSEGWRLSPAYDIVPNLFQTGQLLQVNGRHDGIGLNDVVAEGRAFGFSPARGRQHARAVVEALESSWEEAFRRCEVPEAHTGLLRQDIRARLRRFGGGKA